MKNYSFQIFPYSIMLAIILLYNSCKREVQNLQPLSYSTNGVVFDDSFSSGLNYASFGGAVPTAFDTDKAVKYSGTTAMKFEVPDANNPMGTYVGGSFFTATPRNLSSYNVLTFYIKATQSANIDVMGFGNDFGENKYQVSINQVPVNANWKKIIIPIPDATKLVAEKGMFFISEGPENQKGYTFWIDDVKFENLGTIAFQSASILNGETQNVISFVGIQNSVTNISATYNLPNGQNQIVNLSPYYFNFVSSNPAVASIDAAGNINTIGAGSTTVTALLAKKTALGSITLNSQGVFTPAPVPSTDASKVISIFSDTYTNVPVEYFNGYWAPYQTTQSADFEVNKNHVLNYTNFNFVGIQMTKPSIDAKLTSTMHLDIYLPNTVAANATFKIQLLDIGSDGTTGTNDDQLAEYTVTTPTLTDKKWISLDIPFKSFSNMGARNHIGQIIFIGNQVSNFYADNMYFYNDGSIIPAAPTSTAAAPTLALSNVLSVYSDSYTNISGTDFYPYWGQNTVVSEVKISGNSILFYKGLNYQGTQFSSNIDVSKYSYLHLDYYTANSTSLNFYLISPGPVETPHALKVPSGSGTNGWISVDIPLSTYSPVDLKNIIQFKVDGNGEVYFDNIYFH